MGLKVGYLNKRIYEMSSQVVKIFHKMLSFYLSLNRYTQLCWSTVIVLFTACHFVLCQEQLPGIGEYALCVHAGVSCTVTS